MEKYPSPLLPRGGSFVVIRKGIYEEKCRLKIDPLSGRGNSAMEGNSREGVECGCGRDGGDRGIDA